MTLTDRDKKIIVLLLIVAVIALPYVFYTKDTRSDTETQKAVNVDLQARLTQLQEMNKDRAFYEAETKRMRQERDELIASFPADVQQENYTMWLYYLEKAAYEQAMENMIKLAEDEDDETPRFGYDGIDGNTLFLISSVGYGDNELQYISDEGSTDPLTGIINDSTLIFASYYEGFRYFLDYVMAEELPIIYKSISVEYDPDSGQIEGEVLMEQYAISGQGRKLDPVPVEPDFTALEQRGIKEFGLFGPLSEETRYLNQMFEEYLREKAEEDEEGEEEGIVDNLD